MIIYYRCARLKSQPEMSIPMCIGRWNEAQTSKKRSPCKKCPKFAGMIFDLARSVGMNGYK